MAMAVAGVATLASCLDYDTPEDTLQTNEVKLPDNVYHGNVDSIDYKKEYTADELRGVNNRLSVEVGSFKGAQQVLMGGKINGGKVEKPGPHAYQSYATIAQVYAQYSVIPHSKFQFGDEIRASYHVARGWNAGANGTFVAVKNQLTPLMNHPNVDSIPELKALALLFYNIAAVHNTDLYGPMPYQDFKLNKQYAPFKYDSQEFIYKRAVKNIDDFVACFNYFKKKSTEYKETVDELLNSHASILKQQATSSPDETADCWIRLANSVKLRMAMHIVKRDASLAKKWAEEAVESGVIKTRDQEFYMPAGSAIGQTHPLAGVSEWNDLAPSASFVTLLKSLNHPYVQEAKDDYAPLFTLNKGDITSTDGTLTEGRTIVVGIRSGSKVKAGQGSDNPYTSFSVYNRALVDKAPLYLFKCAEVDFLRAEGALRGWEMKGTAEELYKKGIENSMLLEPYDTKADELSARLQAYLMVESPVEVVYKDPTGKTPNETTRTKIGVKWNEADDREVKLEKIITQKYIALFPNAFEAWTEMRRTGYPKLFPVLTRYNDGSLNPGDLVRRMIFPNDDQASIADIQTSGLDALGGPDQQGTRLWWDVQTPSNF